MPLRSYYFQPGFSFSNAMTGANPAGATAGDFLVHATSWSNGGGSSAIVTPADVNCTRIVSACIGNNATADFWVQPYSAGNTYAFASTTNDWNTIKTLCYSGITGLFTFATRTAFTGGSQNPPATITLAGGSSAAGDDLIVLIGVDPNNSDDWTYAGATWSGGAAFTNLPGSTNSQGAQVGAQHFDNFASGGATGSLTIAATGTPAFISADFAGLVLSAIQAGGGGGPDSPPLLGRQSVFSPIVYSFASRPIAVPQSPVAARPPLQIVQRNLNLPNLERQPAFLRRPYVVASFAPLFMPRGPFTGVADSRQPRVTAAPIATPVVNSPPLVAARGAFVAPVDVRALPAALQIPQLKPPDAPPLLGITPDFVGVAPASFATGSAAVPQTSQPSAPPLLGSSPEFYNAAAAFSLVGNALVAAASPPTPPLLSRATVFAALVDSLLLVRVALPLAPPVADSPPLLTRTPVFSPPIPGWLARGLPGYPIALPPDAPPLLPARSTFGALADVRVPFRVTAIPSAPPPVVPDAPPLLGRAALFVAPPDGPLAGQRFGVPVSGPISNVPPLMARPRAATERAPEFAPARPAVVPLSGPDTPPTLARWRPADAVAVEYRRNPASLPALAADAPPLLGRVRLFEPVASAAPARGVTALPPATPPGQPPLVNKAARFEPLADSFHRRDRAQIPQSVDQPPLTVRAWSFALPPPWFNAGVAALPPPQGAPPLIQRRYQFAPPAFAFFIPRGALIPVSGQRTIIGRFHASVGARVKHAVVPPRNHEAEAGPKQRKASK